MTHVEGLVGAKDTSLSTMTTTFIGEDYSDRAGYSVAMPGDVNKDGYDDILIGAPEDETVKGNYSTGQTYLILGKASGWSNDLNLKNADASFIGEARDDRSGYSVAGAGDVNGDGYGDILIGMFNDQTGGMTKGKAYLIFGKASGWQKNMSLSSVDVTFVGENDGDHAGNSVSSAGDVNGDSIADILIGAPNNGAGGTNAGKAYIILGKRSGWAQSVSLTNADASFMGEGNGAGAGRSVAGAGDVNGDGKGDIIVGSDNAISGKQGRAYVIFGKGSGWTKDANLATADASFIGEHDGDFAGYAVAGVGDVNNDGKDDIAVGAYSNDAAGDSAGRAYIIFGKGTGWSKSVDLGLSDVKLDGESQDDRAGSSVAGVGDVNKDGFDEIMIGAHRNEAGGNMAGQTYLILGRQSGWSSLSTLSQADASFIGEGNNEHSGFSVAGKGDVDKNGQSDILIGTPDRLPITGSSAGEVYLILNLDMAASQVNQSPTATLLLPQNGTMLGTIVPRLEWSGSDPEGDTLSYDVFLDAEITKVAALDPSTQIEDGVILTYHQSTGFDYNTTYYWTVIPDDGHSKGKCGNGIWSFTIGPENGSTPNRPPIIEELKDITVLAGEEVRFRVNASDPDGNKITYSLQGAPANMTINNKTGEVEWNPSQSEVGEYIFRVVVSDSVSNVEIPLRIMINASITPPDGDDGNEPAGFNPLFIILILIVVSAVAAVAVIAVKRRKGAKAGQVPAPQQAIAPGAGPSPSVQPVMETSTPHPSSQMQPAQMGPQAWSAPMVAAVATPFPSPGLVPPAPTKDAGVEDFDVEAVLLMSTDGRLIASEMGADSTMDRDILSSMLTAIGDFVKQSFRDETGLNSFETGGRQVLLIKGQHASLTVVLLGKEPPGLREQMQRMLETFEGQYAGVIDKWDGNLGYFDGVDRLFIPLLDFKKGVAIKEEVKVKSAIEFYQGYVRLKVAVINNFQRTIADATLQIEYDPGALRLAKVEPADIKAEGPVVRLGNIRNSGKKTVAFYLDPLICQGSFIDAHLTYYDFQDVKYHVEMKRRPVDVVCPLFYTKETVNIAVLKRLVSELKNKDARRFRVNGQQNIDKAFREAIAEIKAHDVRLIRTYADSQVGSRRFIGEAWFYGETKDSVDRIVIMTRFSECDMMLELMVAADNLAAQAGLLAEMGAMVKTRCGDILEPLFGERYDQPLCKTGYLLDMDEAAGPTVGDRK